MTAPLTEAYAACEQITRAEARNFYYGIRLLPSEKRSALSAVYALARRIDDIGDGDLPVTDKRAALAAVRESLHRPAGDADAVMAAVHDAARRFPVPLGAFDELIDGVEMDVVGHRYATFEELVTYCTRVAGSVGRLSLGIFGGSSDRRAPAYANALGVALQQTNILRDIREDLTLGRVYLPAEDLDRFGVTLTLGPGGRLDDADGALDALIRAAAARASRWYDDGLRLLPLLDRRSAACCAAMAGIYRSLLDRLEQSPQLSYDRRLSLSGWEKARVAARAMAGRAA
ncbi:MAG: 15-cis-phytoene synthase [Frankiales bacterium]|jgi:phytoene synthase|nr:15-cis-phytoene synthase [Frankiales bacterium]MDX6210699.1 15-cis-phytoene synthase [Frankiales bacterium]MDX6213730.1 15-cis-phytoene synthase [Frankiales bacterium]